MVAGFARIQRYLVRLNCCEFSYAFSQVARRLLAASATSMITQAGGLRMLRAVAHHQETCCVLSRAELFAPPILLAEVFAVPPSYWIAFCGGMVLLLALDMFVFHRHAHEPTLRESAMWTVFWCSLALVFN